MIIYFPDVKVTNNPVPLANYQSRYEGTGLLNLRITARLFDYLEEIGVPTFYKRSLEDRITPAAVVMPVQGIPVADLDNIHGDDKCLWFDVGLYDENRNQYSAPRLQYYYWERDWNTQTLQRRYVNENYLLEYMDQLLDLRIMKFYANKIGLSLRDYFDKNNFRLKNICFKFGLSNAGHYVLASFLTLREMRVEEKMTGKIFDESQFEQPCSRTCREVLDDYNLLYERLVHHVPFPGHYKDGGLIGLLGSSECEAMKQDLQKRGIPVSECNSKTTYQLLQMPKIFIYCNYQEEQDDVLDQIPDNIPIVFLFDGIPIHIPQCCHPKLVADNPESASCTATMMLNY